jgi:hypothetical protein
VRGVSTNAASAPASGETSPPLLPPPPPPPPALPALRWARAQSEGADRQPAGPQPGEVKSGTSDDQTDGGLQILTVRFQDKAQISDRLSGSLRATFETTLSGISGVRLHQAAGSTLQPGVKVTTELEVTVDFELCLRAVRYQDAEAVPEAEHLAVNTHPQVTPDAQTVANLTNKLSERGCYIKRVVENPPRGGWRADRVNRYWDIAGRRYDGIFPVDFRIVLTGEEEYADGLHPRSGSTTTQLSVYGYYVNETMSGEVTADSELKREIITNNDDEAVHSYEISAGHGITMRGRIERELSELRTIIDDFLETQKR